MPGEGSTIAGKCCQCGRCCTHMRDVHRFIEERGDYTFVVHNHYTGDAEEVRVDPDKIALFEDRSSIGGLPNACPFLRFDGETGKAWCTVHLTRPDLCREYCCRLLILDSQGKLAGRVTYQRALIPDTDELGRLWERVQPTLDGLCGTEWDDAFITILTAAGYCVRR
nr:YkgJ family cysteine cluster protein [Methanoculleus sp. 10]